MESATSSKALFVTCISYSNFSLCNENGIKINSIDDVFVVLGSPPNSATLIQLYLPQKNMTGNVAITDLIMKNNQGTTSLCNSLEVFLQS